MCDYDPIRELQQQFDMLMELVGRMAAGQIVPKPVDSEHNCQACEHGGRGHGYYADPMLCLALHINVPSRWRCEKFEEPWNPRKHD